MCRRVLGGGGGGGGGGGTCRKLWHVVHIGEGGGL